MGRIRWVFFSAFAVVLVYAAPRELSTDELITEPRPGEEYVNIQTSSQNKVHLLDQSFTTSHRIPELSKTNRFQHFQTSHKIPDRTSRSVKATENFQDSENWKPHTTNESHQQIIYSVVEGTTSEPPLERVVTKTSIKMSKSKKVQKSVVKVAHDGLADILAGEGVIDERVLANEEEQEIMKKKFLKNEKVEVGTEEFVPPTRFNVPFEDDVKVVNFENTHVLIPNPVIATTQEPPITTFNYKNVYNKSKKDFASLDSGSHKLQDKYKYETIISESIKTAESKSVTSKKDTKQEKKYKKEELNQGEESGFYVLPVNKQISKFKEDNYDFVDVEEKVLVPAGSSPSQSSRINIKKGPNGQDYEYEYVYYYYDDDDEGSNGGNPPKEGKVASTTEKIYNGHDGPAKVDQEQNSLQSTSTSGSKYLPTESTKSSPKNRKRPQEEVIEATDEVSAQNFVSKSYRGGSNNSSRFTSSNKQFEPSNNEVLPTSARSQFRPRGRASNTATVPTEEIPPIGEERLPANTRFPPRSRANNAPVTSPQPHETTARTKGRDGTNQSRLRIPSLGLLDSSSFRTHASDASVEEDAIHDAELQRQAAARGQTTETVPRRGTRPSTTITVNIPEAVPAVTRRPITRKPTDDRRTRIPVEEEPNEELVEGRRSKEKVPLEENEGISRVPLEGNERLLKVPVAEEEEKRPKVPLEEDQKIRGPQVPLEDESSLETQRQKEATVETPLPEERPLQTTRESDAEEGVFDQRQYQGVPSQAAIDQTRNLEARPVDFTTEDQSLVGLTSTMMEKVALDLYAILQQAQNENIQTNFIDGNSTDITTDLGEGQTEFSIYDDGSTPEPSSTTTSTTTTTTTTTTLAPSTTTTTTAPPPTQALGRGRYRGRVANGNKGRSKVSTTTTTEVPEEVPSPRTRGRFQPNHSGSRGSGTSFARKPFKSAAKESTSEPPASEETPKLTPERTFGDRPRNRFRASGKVTSNAPSTAAAPPSPPTGTGVSGARGSAPDRFHSRRRGGRPGLPPTQHAAAEAPVVEEEIHQDTPIQTEEASSSPSPLRPTRPRIGGSVRPLRPGPRAPLLLPQRGHGTASPAANTASASPVDNEEIEKEVFESEGHFQQANEEVQETTPAGDALSRLKSRPRLRIGTGNNHQRPATPPPPSTNRRKLVSSLLPKRKPNEEKAVEKTEEPEEKLLEEIPGEEEVPAAPAEPSSTTAEPESKGLSGLLAGRRRNLNRRPGTIYSRAQPAEA